MTLESQIKTMKKTINQKLNVSQVFVVYVVQFNSVPCQCLHVYMCVCVCELLFFVKINTSYLYIVMCQCNCCVEYTPIYFFFFLS